MSILREDVRSSFKISRRRMRSGTRSRYTLAESVKAGESRLQDKCLRGSNKGISQINTFPGSSKIEQIFISHNQITTLNGVQNFKNLRVLSISFNEISKISDLKFLEGLPLETVNLEGNPITQQPYYQHHVVALLPQLSLFDGKTVNDTLRKKARDIVDFDTQRLTDLCVNEARLAQLDSLLKNKSGAKSTSWRDAVERMLDPNLTLASFEMTDAEISDAFDKMRQVAVDLRAKQTSAPKWAEIYNTIEDVQRSATQDLSNRLAVEIQNLSAVSTKKTKQASAFLALEKMVTSQTPPTRLRRSSSSRTESSACESEATMPLASAIVIPQPSPLTEHLGTILERMRNRAAISKSFWKWRCRRRSTPLNSNSKEHGSLLEHAQECVARIAVLESELDESQREKRELAAALEESVKNETKISSVAQKLAQERDALARCLRASEKKYEDDVLQFILETKFSNDSAASLVAKLESEVRRLEIERDSLQEFVREVQEEHQHRVDELSTKLQSAFDVASGFRREISKLRAASYSSSSSSPERPPVTEGVELLM